MTVIIARRPDIGDRLDFPDPAKAHLSGVVTQVLPDYGGLHIIVAGDDGESRRFWVKSNLEGEVV